MGKMRKSLGKKYFAPTIFLKVSESFSLGVGYNIKVLRSLGKIKSFFRKNIFRKNPREGVERSGSPRCNFNGEMMIFGSFGGENFGNFRENNLRSIKGGDV